MRRAILESANDAVKAIDFLRDETSLAFIETVAKLLADTDQAGGKVIVAGNGGSLCDSMHFAEELTGFFREKRRPIAAMALADPGHMSAVSNDAGFEYVFARYVESLGKPEDVFVALTTSGNSQNLIEAVKAAQANNMKTVAFLGKTGGALKGMCDLEWIIEGFKTSDRIQEAHMTAIHIIIEMMEKELERRQCITPLKSLLNVSSKATVP